MAPIFNFKPPSIRGSAPPGPPSSTLLASGGTIPRRPDSPRESWSRTQTARIRRGRYPRHRSSPASLFRRNDPPRPPPTHLTSTERQIPDLKSPKPTPGPPRQNPTKSKPDSGTSPRTKNPPHPRQTPPRPTTPPEPHPRTHFRQRIPPKYTQIHTQNTPHH